MRKIKIILKNQYVERTFPADFQAKLTSNEKLIEQKLWWTDFSHL